MAEPARETALLASARAVMPPRPAVPDTSPAGWKPLEENRLVEVVLPKGVKGYQFQVVRPAEPPAAEPPAAQPAETPEETNATGSIAPSSPSAPETPPAPPPSSPDGKH